MVTYMNETDTEYFEVSFMDGHAIRAVRTLLMMGSANPKDFAINGGVRL